MSASWYSGALVVPAGTKAREHFAQEQVRRRAAGKYEALEARRTVVRECTLRRA